MASRRWVWPTIVGLLLGVGCTSTDSSARPSTSIPPAEAVGRTVETVPLAAVTEPAGVPGLAADDPFCSAWAGYAGTLQALGIAASFGELSSDRFAALELVAAPRLVEVTDAIGALWPTELAGERTVVIEQRIGPYARRARSAVATLADAGLSAAELVTLSGAWEAALLARDPENPVITVPALADPLRAKVDAAAVAFDAAVTPFAQDPSLVIDGVAAAATDAYLVAHCPDLASSGVGDAL
ncbi:MAG: hypothetical protein ABI862_10855 [Ilumatobacteraceae bacterium]